MFPGGRSQNKQPGGQLPMVQYPGMYYSSASGWPASAPKDDGRDVLAESYERMRREMRSLQGGTPSNAPPPPSMDSSRDNAAIKMLLTNENVSLSSLLEAAMDPSTGSNKGTEDPIMKKTVLDKCEGKIAQLYRHRISGMGTFFPNVPIKGTKAKSSCFLTFHHPRVEFNMTSIKSIWNCPDVKVETGKIKKSAETVVEESANAKRDKSPALEAAEEFANKPNPSLSTDLFRFELEKPAEPIPGQIPVIGPRQELPTIDLTKPPPIIVESYPDPPADPYATTAFELWAEIERERRHKEKLKEWEMLNVKHKERDKEERKRKKKKHRHSRSGSRSHSRSRSRSKRRSRSRRQTRSRSRHTERRWTSRSRRRSRSISLSPSPPRKRSISPHFVERGRLSHSPRGRSPSRYQRSSPGPMSGSLVSSPTKYSTEPYPRQPPGPPGDEWSSSPGWPSSGSHIPRIPESYEPYGGGQNYPDGVDYYYGNTSGSYQYYCMPPNYYGMRSPYPPSGYPMGGPPRGPLMWGARGPPPYSYRPPPPGPHKPAPRKRSPPKLKEAKIMVSRNLVQLSTTPTGSSEERRNKSKPVSNVTPVVNPKIDSSKKTTAEVIVLDDDKPSVVDSLPKSNVTSDDHPPGVSPDRELPQTTYRGSSDRESEFTKPMRAKFRELLKPFDKILDTIKIRQRDCEDYKPLIKGLEIGSCEFDGVYTLVEGILCRVVIDAAESSKTCFKIVLSPVHVTPILMEIHKKYHDYSSSKIKRTIEDLFYDTRQFPSWKIGNVMAICKQCRNDRKKREEMARQKSHEKDVGDNSDWGKSKSKSHKHRSESKGRDDRKKSRRGSREDHDQPEKSESHRAKKRELKDTLKGGDVLINVVKELSSKMDGTSKQTADSAEKARDSAEGKTDETRESEANHNELVPAPTEKKGRSAQPEPVPSKKPKDQKTEEAPVEKNGGSSTTGSQKPEVEIVEPSKPPRKPLVPYAKPEDFKLRVRNAQMMMDDLKTHIKNLEGPVKKTTDPSYLLKAGMLCKRTTCDDGKTEVKIAVTPQSLLKMIQIVHTMASTHAPLEKTILVFNKHFTPILGVQEAVSIVLNNCEECGSP